MVKLSKIETFLDLPSNHVNKDGGKREKAEARLVSHNATRALF